MSSKERSSSKRVVIDMSWENHSLPIAMLKGSDVNITVFSRKIDGISKSPTNIVFRTIQYLIVVEPNEEFISFTGGKNLYIRLKLLKRRNVGFNPSQASGITSNYNSDPKIMDGFPGGLFQFPSSHNINLPGNNPLRKKKDTAQYHPFTHPSRPQSEDASGSVINSLSDLPKPDLSREFCHSGLPIVEDLFVNDRPNRYLIKVKWPRNPPKVVSWRGIFNFHLLFYLESGVSRNYHLFMIKSSSCFSIYSKPSVYKEKMGIGKKEKAKITSKTTSTTTEPSPSEKKTKKKKKKRKKKKRRFVTTETSTTFDNEEEDEDDDDDDDENKKYLKKRRKPSSPIVVDDDDEEEDGNQNMNFPPPTMFKSTTMFKFGRNLKGVDINQQPPSIHQSSLEIQRNNNNMETSKLPLFTKTKSSDDSELIQKNRTGNHKNSQKKVKRVEMGTMTPPPVETTHHVESLKEVRMASDEDEDEEEEEDDYKKDAEDASVVGKKRKLEELGTDVMYSESKKSKKNKDDNKILRIDDNYDVE